MKNKAIKLPQIEPTQAELYMLRKKPFKTMSKVDLNPGKSTVDPRRFKWVRGNWYRLGQRNACYVVSSTKKRFPGDRKPVLIPLYVYLPEKRRWYGNRDLLHPTLYVPPKPQITYHKPPKDPYARKLNKTTAYRKWRVDMKRFAGNTPLTARDLLIRRLLQVHPPCLALDPSHPAYPALRPFLSRAKPPEPYTGTPNPDYWSKLQRVLLRFRPRNKWEHMTPAEAAQRNANLKRPRLIPKKIVEHGLTIKMTKPAQPGKPCVNLSRWRTTKQLKAFINRKLPIKSTTLDLRKEIKKPMLK